MFGRWKKETRLAELNAAVAEAEPLATSENLDAVKAALRPMRKAWLAATKVSYDFARPGYDLMKKLEARMDELERLARERAVKACEDVLRPCAQCRGRSFRISGVFCVERFGDLRVAICLNCTAIVMFAADRERVISNKHPELTLGPEITVSGEQDPFR